MSVSRARGELALLPLSRKRAWRAGRANNPPQEGVPHVLQVGVYLGMVLEDASADPNVRGVQAFNPAIAHHPRLDSIIEPTYKGKLDGISISVVK
jgi:hypothetical protein